eukprot:SAG11_NODE_6785_length_1249_cov_1.449565_2_plen_252_part_00
MPLLVNVALCMFLLAGAGAAAARQQQQQQRAQARGEWKVPCPTHKLGSCRTPSGVSTTIRFDPPLTSSAPNISLSFARCTNQSGQWIDGPCPCCGDVLELRAVNVTASGATLTLAREPAVSFGSSFVVSWKAPAPPPPAPLPPAAPHLSVMTFYGFNETAQCGWTNVMWQELAADPHDQPFKKSLPVALRELVSFSVRCNGTGLVMLPVHFFAANAKGLPETWEADLTAFEQHIELFVRNGTAIGVFSEAN